MTRSEAWPFLSTSGQDPNVLPRNRDGQEKLSRRSSGQTGVDLDELRKYPLALPTLAEQEAIAEALGDADTLIESLEQLVAKKRHLKQAAMQQLLTGKKRLPGFEAESGYQQTEVSMIPKDWELRRVDSVCRLINGRGFKPFEWEGAGLPIIRIQNLNGSDEFNFFNGVYDKKLEIEPGQLLFAWSGSRGTSFGPHVWPGPLGLLNYHTWKVQVYDSEVSPEFFLYALQQLTAFIEGQARGASALVHAQKWEMEGFNVPIPPDLEEQEAIVNALSDMDKEFSAIEESWPRLVRSNRA
ncbi:MAG: restriction endonuclease subunit S [Planctomycetales bacterium]